jgi:uncharacterized protein
MTINTTAPKPPTVIHIQGRATVNSIAERATLTVHVSDLGYDKDKVSANVVSSVDAVQTQLEQLCSRLEDGDISPASPITFYSIASLAISTGDDYDHSTGTAADPDKKRYTASSDISIQFRDFSVLSDVVVRFSAMAFVGVQGVEWQLTEAKTAWLDEEVRMQALKNAMERAQAYARIVGREHVTCVKIEDAQEFWPMGRGMMQARQKTAAVEAFSVGAGIQFEPGKVEVSGTLSVEFHAE